MVQPTEMSEVPDRGTSMTKIRGLEHLNFKIKSKQDSYPNLQTKSNAPGLKSYASGSTTVISISEPS